MTDSVRIASAQLNQVVGDIAGNVTRIAGARAQAAQQGAELVAAPELSIVGYPPEDLILKPAFVRDAMAAARSLALQTGDGGPGLVVGAPWLDGGQLYNASILMDGGEITAVRYKHDLPNYGVFDEKRIFTPGPIPEVATWRGLRLGLPICEDIWSESVPNALIESQCDFLVCINGSPWRRSILYDRRTAFMRWLHQSDPPLIFVNQVGGQDELVFDGASFSWFEGGDFDTFQQLPAFETALDVAEWLRTPTGGWVLARAHHDAALARQYQRAQADWGIVYKAAVCAIRDYVTKNRFPGVVIGLSGGVDSALTAALAVDALGPDKVWCVMLPSRYTSQESLEDAAACAQALGVRLDTIPIGPGVQAVDEMLAGYLDTPAADVSLENVQSRLRGALLMALSNAHGHMVLTTGNKSEMAVGYATLYGDMNGGYNALKDLYKTEVFAIARWRNTEFASDLLGPNRAVIPDRILTKAPSAELRADQTDQDSLPPYEILDDILRGLVDGEEEVDTVIARGHQPDVVAHVQNLVYRAEYKRRQAPPGAKIGSRNFGRDRRYPLTNHYRDHS